MWDRMSHDRDRWEDRYAGKGVSATDPRFQSEGSLAAPSAFVVAHADRINGRVLDVAAGSGRNAVFLARRGAHVEAIDIAFAGLATAQRHAAAAGVSLALVQADLESYPLPRSRYDAVLNIRYLQRSLFTPMQRAVKPGGIVLFETFLIDQQALGHPKNPRYLLQRGELRDAFATWDVLVNEEGLFDVPGGRAYLARLLARRRLRD
jgi:tellurite methyltransferase